MPAREANRKAVAECSEAHGIGAGARVMAARLGAR